MAHVGTGAAVESERVPAGWENGTRTAMGSLVSHAVLVTRNDRAVLRFALSAWMTDASVGGTRVMMARGCADAHPARSARQMGKVVRMVAPALRFDWLC
jgi:hypothetical protein